MLITSDEDETRYLIRLEGEADVTGAAALKRRLLEAVSSRKEIQLDLAAVSDIDITAIQLLWAAWHETEKTGTAFAVVGLVPENIGHTLCEVGFAEYLEPLIPKTVLGNSGAPLTENADD